MSVPFRGSHPGPQEPGPQRDAVSTAESRTGWAQEEAAGQCRPLPVGNRRGQIHAEILPHWILALLWETQWRLVTNRSRKSEEKFHFKIKLLKRTKGSECKIYFIKKEIYFCFQVMIWWKNVAALLNWHQERHKVGAISLFYKKTKKKHEKETNKLFTSKPLLFSPRFPPAGVLWFSVISEFMYIGLLAMGFLLMCVEAMCLCAKKEMSSLKINAYAAMCTILSGENSFTETVQNWVHFFLLKLILNCLFSACIRYDGDGSSYDVLHSVSDDCEHRAKRLEATVLGLRMVVCVS